MPLLSTKDLMASPIPRPEPLNHNDFATVVRLAPLAAIDLIIRDASNRVLVGLRNNEPAKDSYFVPGGRIWKGERLRHAFERILLAETNCSAAFDEARSLGAYEHFYPNNRFGEPGFGTHYVVLAYEVRPEDVSVIKVDGKHPP